MKNISAEEYKSLLAFYKAVTKVVKEWEFDAAKANKVVEEYKKLNSQLGVPTNSIFNTLHKANLEHKQNDDGYKNLDILVEGCMRDLALHLHDSKARHVLNAMILASHTVSEEYLHVYVRSSRLLGKDKKGPIAVTIIAHSAERLFQLLQDPDGTEVEESHVSYAPGVEKIQA